MKDKLEDLAFGHELPARDLYISQVNEDAIEVGVLNCEFNDYQHVYLSKPAMEQIYKWLGKALGKPDIERLIVDLYLNDKRLIFCGDDPHKWQIWENGKMSMKVARFLEEAEKRGEYWYDTLVKEADTLEELVKDA